MTSFPSDLRVVVDSLMVDIDTPRSLTVYLMVKYSEFDQLVVLTVDPLNYDDAERLLKDRLATDLLRKCQDLPLKEADPTKAAKSSWLEAERLCYETNMRFQRHINQGPFQDINDLRVHEHLLAVRKIFRELMGPLPSHILHYRHGPGSTYRDRGKLTTVPDKMSTRPTITSRARDLLPIWGETSWARELMRESANLSDPETLDCDRFVTVPKDAVKHRGISIGPSINTYFQLGVGMFLRGRLLKNGIDLEHGQDTHRQVACRASSDGSFCTIDLSSASDTMSRGVIRFLSDHLWYAMLDSLRTPCTQMDGKTWRLQKFSAMGNGFTFELETMLFASLAIHACEACGIEPKLGTNIFVYGDDIIVPNEVSRSLISLLGYFGFKPNTKKTFSEGYFRESCGGDYFNGTDVRPYFIKEYPNEPQKWISLANGLRHIGVGDNSVWIRPWIKRTWFRAMDPIPTNVRRCRGPKELGDLVIHDVESLWQMITRSSIRYLRVWRPVVRPIPLYHWKPGIQLASALYGVPSTGPIPRDSVSGYRFGRVAFS